MGRFVEVLPERERGVRRQTDRPTRRLEATLLAWVEERLSAQKAWGLAETTAWTWRLTSHSACLPEERPHSV